MKTNVRKHERSVKGKTVRVKKHRRKNKISRKKRKVFTSMAKQPYELGGQLDFEGGDLQNAKVHFGGGSEVEFDWDPDYENSFHTHTNSAGASVMPSYQDILSMKETDEKEQIIFRGVLALSVAENKKFLSVSNSVIKNVSRELGKDLDNGFSDAELYRKYRPIFKERLGLAMNLHGPDKDIKLDTRSR